MAYYNHNQLNTNSGLNQQSGIQGPGVVESFRASEWVTFPSAYKATIITRATYGSGGKDAQVFLDTTHPDRAIVAITRDLLTHHPYLRVETRVYAGESMPALVANRTPHNLHPPQMTTSYAEPKNPLTGPTPPSPRRNPFKKPTPPGPREYRFKNTFANTFAKPTPLPVSTGSSAGLGDSRMSGQPYGTAPLGTQRSAGDAYQFNGSQKALMEVLKDYPDGLPELNDYLFRNPNIEESG
ncbi:hypothetical protein F4821DRAFT_281545 [Hypoxylon rubiginosum]|uniref:Uncharacterized protein n=1 Tax=Hypoxylon rubiginosum TaxID=110542 RepID=A0ACC0CQM7_9PEZI|nr:hypothetical protein F4821DRAFT_281545 [Hypoxylon rubiginosum]